MWRRSWLSREVLLFTALLGGRRASTPACLWLGFRAARRSAASRCCSASRGVTASACIYRVPSRPAWNTPLTLVQFNLTALMLGPLFAAADDRHHAACAGCAAGDRAVAGAQFVVLALRFFRISGSDTIELQASSRLLATTLRTPFIAGGCCWRSARIALPLCSSTPGSCWGWPSCSRSSGEGIGR